MLNMATGARAAETAINSHGSAMRENETWMRSLEGRIRQFNTAFETLSSNLINSGLVGFFVDAGAALVRLVGVWDGWLLKIAAVPAGIALLTSAFNQIRNTQFLGGIIKDISGFGERLQEMNNALETMSNLGTRASMDDLVNSTRNLNSAHIALVTSRQKELVVDSAVVALQEKGLPLTEKNIKAEVKRQVATTGLTGAKLKQTTAQITNSKAAKAAAVVDVGATKTLKAKTKAGKGAVVVNTKVANSLKAKAKAGKVSIVVNKGVAKSLKLKTAASNSAAAAFGKLAIAWLKTPMGIGTAAVALILGIVAGVRRWNQVQEENNQLIRERAQETREELETLDELIAKYRQLRTAMVFDESARAEVRDIQEQITDLVGDQASNLDLVNGGLSEQLFLLDKINREQARVAAKAAEMAAEVALNLNRRVLISQLGSSSSSRVRWNKTLNTATFREDLGSDFRNRDAQTRSAPSVRAMFSTRSAREQVEMLVELEGILTRMSNRGYDVAKELEEVNSELARLRPYVNDGVKALNYLFDTALQASRQGRNLSNFQTDFFRNIITANFYWSFNVNPIAQGCVA